MEVTLRWDEERLGKLVEQAKQARRRLRKVAWSILALSVAMPRLIGYLTMPRAPSTAAGWTPAPTEFIQPAMVCLVIGFAAAIALLFMPSARRLVRLYLLFAGIMCLAGLTLMAVNAFPAMAWHPVTGATPLELLGYALMAAVGVVLLLCARTLNRGAIVFACDYVRGEIADWTVVQGLLQAEGPAYQQLRDQVGLG